MGGWVGWAVAGHHALCTHAGIHLLYLLHVNTRISRTVLTWKRSPKARHVRGPHIKQRTHPCSEAALRRGMYTARHGVQWQGCTPSEPLGLLETALTKRGVAGGDAGHGDVQLFIDRVKLQDRPGYRSPGAVVSGQ